MEARALIGKDAVGLIEATTASLDFGGSPSGSLTELQIKAYRSGNALAFTLNRTLDQASFQETTTGLYHGQQLQVQAHVRGLDGNRTDVITARPTVRLRPDLAVRRLDGPSEARVGLPVNISAVVAELNGETGARADCVLRADGVEVDRAPAIWVDAGGSVSCRFMPTFESPGIRQLRADVAGVTPGDWDEANNAASLTLNVYAHDQPLEPTGVNVVDFEDHTSRYERTVWLSSGPPAQGAESERRDTSDGWSQTESLYSYPRLRLMFPVASLSVSITKDGSARSWTYENLVPSWTWSFNGFEGACVQRFDTETDADRAVMFEICSSWSSNGANSFVGYFRDAGDVTYFSSAFTRTWFETPDNTTSYWSRNDTFTNRSGQRVPAGSHYTFEVRLVSGGNSYDSRVEVDVQPVSQASRFPPEGEPICHTFDWGGGTTEWCREETFQRVGFFGYGGTP